MEHADDRAPESSDRALDAQADAFAQLLASSHDVDATFRQAAALARGLFPHQVEGVAFLLGRRRAILADDMGLGKTRQAIVALHHIAPDGRYLVVCPASVKRNWEREILACAPECVQVLEGTAPQTPEADARWVIVNYDVLAKQIGPLSTVAWAGLIFDEAHYLKNHTSARSRLARQLAQGAAAAAGTQPPAVYLLTGTPLTNRPRDLFVLLQLVEHPLGRSFLSFAKRYCAATRNEYGWKTDGASNLEELTVQLHGVMLRRRKEDVLALPPKLRTWLPTTVPAGTAAREVRDVLGMLLARRAGALDVEGGGGQRQSRIHLLALLTVARQKLAAAKAPMTRELVEGAIDQGEKVIVFSCFEAPLTELAASFGDRAVVVTGKTPTAARQALVDRFQHDDEVRVFLANIIAGGVGLNLTAASQVVFNDLDWVPANHWQAEDRAYRIGQRRIVNVTYMVAEGTIDSFVQAVLETKAALVRAVVDAEALGDVSGDVLAELERALGALSPALQDADHSRLDEDTIEHLLREAAERWRASHARTDSTTAHQRVPAEHIAYLRKALETLAAVLAGPKPVRFRVNSASKPGSSYAITVDGADVTCDCPGFEYRGQCRHAREVKQALATGRALPKQYVSV
jgi:SWI/SNF-related matrix-associated actin-dependent regulator 1 of chromatin subfamily A